MTTTNATQANFTIGLVRKLAEFKTVELQDGQMLARKIEKGTGKDSLGVVIVKPEQEQFILALENESVLQGAYNWYLQQVEQVCKAKMVNSGNITESDYNIANIASYLDSQAISEGRISKERIAQWFNSDVAPVLQAAFKAKLGESLTEEKLQHITNAYRDNFKSLAKREIVLADAVKVNLNKALELLTADSSLKQYCHSKVNAAVQPVIDLEAL